MTTEARPAWLDGSLFPFTSHRVRAGGADVRFVDEGEGPLLLLLHGNPTWSFLYRDVIRRLSDVFRCVAPDLPGFGLSPAPPGWGHTAAEHAAVLEAFVETLDLRGVVLVAHDWGGPLGTATAARHADRYRGVVVTNTWAWPPRAVRIRAFSRVAGSPAARWLVRRSDLLTLAVLRLGTRRPLSPAEQRHYTAVLADPASRLSTHVLARELLSGRALLEEAARGVETLSALPALVVWGQRDPAFGTRQRRRWENAFPDHTTVLLEEAGHLVPEDAPAELAGALRDWHPGAA